LYIESIELDNFKSFGKKTFIPFLPGFTAVSGPNGSGKSNIIDGFLFILGFSNKTIRAEKMPDLINNLTNKPEMKVTVGLYDQNTRNRFFIGRRIRKKKNNQYESTYLLDHRAVTLSAIQEFLSKYKISSKAHNIVMQGDVTRIISMSALERRKIIDELSGVAEFDRKIEEAQKEIEQATLNFKEQEILLSELKNRLSALGPEKEKAVIYQELKEKRNILEKVFHRVRLKQLEIQSNELKEKIALNNQDFYCLQKEIKELIQGQRDLEKELELAKKKLQDLELDQKAKQEKVLTEQKTKLTKTESNLEFIQKQIVDYQKQIERIKKENKFAEKQINNKDLEFEKTQRELDLEAIKLEKLELKYRDIQEKILEKSQDKNLSTGQVLETQKKINFLGQKKTEQETFIKLKKENLEQTQEEILDLRKKFEEALETEEKLKIKAERSQSFNLQKEINSQHSYLQKLKLERKETQQEIESCTELIYQYQNEINKLDLKKEIENSNQSFGRTIKVILDLKAQYSGIFGVLAQLGQVETDFQLALETCSGSRLKSIVVDHEQTATRLIQFLRQKNLGRATFLPLSKLKQIYLPELPAYKKGVVDWAVNLVDCSFEYQKAFAYAFGSTLVLENLEVAQPLIGVYRMVTLQGDLIEKAGAMTGGSNNQRRANYLLNQEEKLQVRELPRKLAEQKEKLSFLREAFSELERELENSQKETEKTKQAFSEKKIQYQIEANKLKAHQNNLEKIQVYLRELGKKREENLEQIEEKNLELKESQSKLQKLNILLISQTSALKDSGLEELVNYSQELEFEKKNLEIELEKKRLEINQVNQHKDLIRGSLIKSEQEIVDCEKKLVVFFAEKRTEQDSLNLISLETQKTEEIFHKTKTEIKKLNSQKENLNQEVHLKEQLKIKLENKYSSLKENTLFLEKKLIELEERIVSLRKEDSLKRSSQLELDKATDKNFEFKKDLESWSREKIEKEINNLELNLAKLEPINMRAIGEYQENQKRVLHIDEKLQKIKSEKRAINSKMKNYGQSKLNAFWEAYNQVNLHFSEIFRQLSFGKGELKLENSEQPFEGGLSIIAKPRNKELQKLDSMSGGEKSLTALSLIFALQRYNPSCFYAFDEVDMFLDGLNAQRLAKMVEEQSRLAQFIVVSLRKPMLEACDRAIGVYAKSNGFTQISGLNLKKRIEIKKLDQIQTKIKQN